MLNNISCHHLILVLGTLYGDMGVTQDVSEVTGRIKHALLARFPRCRYVTGIDSNLAIFLTHLPTILVDFVVGLKTPILSPNKDVS